MTEPRGTRLSHDERRAQLVRLGLDMLGERPYDQVSITALARAAGISKGLLYHYFPTKSDFVVAVLRQSRDELDLRMAPDPALGPSERLDASLEAFLTYVAGHATGYLAVARARGGDDAAIRGVLEEGRRRRIATMVEFSAALAGVPRAEIEGPALEAALEGWLSFCEGVVVRWLQDDGLQQAQVQHLLRRVLLSALASLAAIEPAPAFARLAEAAQRAAGDAAGLTAAP
ncbi:MAG TPA: TetR/AcrR family transcriptional regulator [Baekduia sp.]|nr:TetR/AcrR family transcriptional regulator [Baekduia sp.]